MFNWYVVSKKSVKMYLNTLKILHYIPKLNFVARIKFGFLELICTYKLYRYKMIIDDKLSLKHQI